MFQTTFLGHQGWLVSTETTTILLDPLLTAEFGHGGLAGRLYPPRRVDIAAFPPVDAVIITHEHDDHFDIPSLHRMDRAIPIHLSRGASQAAFGVLRAMGFSVHALQADATLSLGDLRYRTFAATSTTSDEWGVFPFLVWDRRGHGSLASSIDVAPTPAWLESLAKVAPRPGIWAHASNTSNDAFSDALATGPRGGEDSGLVAAAFLKRYAQIEGAWGRPAATLVCGGGWSYEGERAWMNHNAFVVEPTRLAASIAAMVPAMLAVAPVPGETVTLHEGVLSSHATEQPYLRTEARGSWPDRRYLGDVACAPDCAPACGRADLTDPQLSALIDELVDLARYLYGRSLFRGVHAREDGGFAFSLRTGGDAIVLRYEPAACRFVRVQCAEPTESYAVGVQCWASDLHALLVGAIGPSALCYAGRLRVWNRERHSISFGARDLWRFAHPLRRPEPARRLYAQILAAQPAAAARIVARDRSSSALAPRPRND